jgi:hypothetical protein
LRHLNNTVLWATGIQGSRHEFTDQTMIWVAIVVYGVQNRFQAIDFREDPNNNTGIIRYGDPSQFVVNNHLNRLSDTGVL